MFRDRDIDLNAPAVANQADLVHDLGLNTLLQAMAGNDRFLHEVATHALLTSLTVSEEIMYRQHIFADCLEHPTVITDMYMLATTTLKVEKGIFGGLIHYPSSILHYSIEALTKFVDALRQLRNIAADNTPTFRSEGLTTLFALLQRELDDDYFALINTHLKRLQFPAGVLLSAHLGLGNKGTGYTLRKPPAKPHPWWNLFPRDDERSYSFKIADRDEAGANAIAALHGTGINLVANALAQSTDHILNFFQLLRTELAFYIGCLNLHHHLSVREQAICFPEPAAAGPAVLHSCGLRDVVLALTSAHTVVGNDLAADGKTLVMITGTNQGGKSTLLRSIGQAQLMMQAGMMVGATAFSATVCPAILTHYKREEDTTMVSGKLDEELARMRDIAEDLRPGDLVLFNESFASTNEREGSEIGRQIISALTENGIRVIFVTHLYELAHGLHRQHTANALFLHAPRATDGVRTFRIVEGEPLPTSFGGDLYRSIFGTEPPRTQELTP